MSWRLRRRAAFYCAVFLSLLSILCRPLVSRASAEEAADSEPSSWDSQIKQLKKQITAHADRPAALAQLYAQLGLIYQQQDLLQHTGGDLQRKALAAYDKAITLERRVPATIVINYQKGVLLKMMGEGQKSVSTLLRLLEYDLHPADESTIHYFLADSYLLLGDISKALSSYNASLNLTPCKTERYYGYVQALREQNALSREQWQQVVDLLLLRANQCHNLQSITQDTYSIVGLEDDTLDIAAPMILSTTLEQAYLPAKQADILYAIAYLYDKLKQESLAYHFLTQANSVEKAVRPALFHPEDVVLQLNNSNKIFHKNFWNGLLLYDASLDDIEHAHVRIMPVFIVGMMRSGSTLLESMLDSHSDIVGVGEESVFNAQLSQLRDGLVQATHNSTARGAGENPVDAMRKVIVSFRKRVNKLLWEKVKHKITPRPPTSSTSSRRTIYVVDKMLFNYRNIGFLHLVYPTAPILHIHRDPMDCLFSIYKFKFDDAGLDWSLDWNQISLVYSLYLEYMHHFRKRLGRRRITDIRYEDLVRNPHSHLKEILEEKLNVSFQETVLDFHKQKRSVLTNSQAQVRQKLYQSSIGSWRRYHDSLRPVIAMLQPYIRRLQEKGALAFNSKVNWNLSFDHADYTSDSSASTEARQEAGES